MNQFTCDNCGFKVHNTPSMGVKNRNHCPKCLYSKHLDVTPGDRKASCKGLMEPVGTTTKKVAPDKYGKDREGELMLIHKCKACGKISLNRIAGDDDMDKIDACKNK